MSVKQLAPMRGISARWPRRSGAHSVWQIVSEREDTAAVGQQTGGDGETKAQMHATRARHAPRRCTGEVRAARAVIHHVQPVRSGRQIRAQRNVHSDACLRRIERVCDQRGQERSQRGIVGQRSTGFRRQLQRDPERLRACLELRPQILPARRRRTCPSRLPT